MHNKNVRKTSEEVRKGPASLLKISRSSVSACANQPPGFSLSGTLIPNELFIPNNYGIKKISELLQTASLTILNFC